ncbi:MAG: hypothetical protein M1812_003964 [Candelaria pacifica]|nr:MAG: hypothetical protein M1812_003964 [Candelaria pacifica]
MTGTRFNGKASKAAERTASLTMWNPHSNMFGVLEPNHAAEAVPPHGYAKNDSRSTVCQPWSVSTTGDPSSQYAERRTSSRFSVLTSTPTTPTLSRKFVPTATVVATRRSQAYMKQSCLSVEERDPILFKAEQNRGRLLSKQVYHVGMIFRGAHHEGYITTQTLTNITDNTRTDTAHGPICTKYRKMIVIALHHDHCIAIPLFTHNGNGLEGKERPDEFVSVRDHRAKYIPAFIPLSKHQALSTEIMNPGVELLDAKCTAHITYPISRRYDLPIIQEGTLSKVSITRLILLYNNYRPRTIE